MRKLLKHKIVSDYVFARFGQIFCFSAACLIPVIVFRKFAKMEMTEANLLIGVLATMCLALLMTIIGILLEPPKKS